jgi:prepilin-type N-terminal cleavage/methylation domain-containing protein
MRFQENYTYTLYITTAYGNIERMHRGYHKRTQGFTIIEVLIVLAIAGVILLIVFLAVPQAMRVQRDNARRGAVQYAATQLDQYYSEHNTYPYMGASVDNRSEFVAEMNATGEAKNFDIYYDTDMMSHEFPFAGPQAPADLQTADSIISIAPGHQCNRTPGLGPGDTDYPIMTSPNGDIDYRRYVIWILLENGSIYCLDNQH